MGEESTSTALQTVVLDPIFTATSHVPRGTRSTAFEPSAFIRDPKWLPGTKILGEALDESEGTATLPVCARATRAESASAKLPGAMASKVSTLASIP
jgi:hypothetical protein